MQLRTVPFNAQGKCKIVQFTDVHWNDGLSQLDIDTRSCMERVIREEKPDLIIITGDLVYGEKNLDELPNALKPVLDSGVPWALVFGNHDAEWGHSREELCQKAMSLPNCLMEEGDPEIEGVGNYVLAVQDGEKLAWALYCVDSNTYNANKSIGTYGFIHRNQIAWYVNTAQMLEKEKGKHSALAFFHIALPEYNEVWNYCTCYGEKHEEVCCPDQNSGMFSAMLEMGNMKGTFAGHDHVNDYCGELFGVQLCYGRATGHNTYGHYGFVHGARVIELDRLKPNTFNTWVRLENGDVIERGEEHQPEYKRHK